MDRRAFFKKGLMAATFLITGSTIYACSDLDILDPQLINDDVDIALTAILPVFLAPALPELPPQRQQVLAGVIEGMKTALEKLPPRTLDELNDLFSLLTNRLVILAYAGTLARTDQLSGSQANELIEGWRTSYIGLMNIAYAGLKELVFAAFYGDPQHWPLLNYQKPNLGD